MSPPRHELESQFGLSARDILDVIRQHNRCLISVRGAIAEEHLRRILERLQQRKVIETFAQIDRDGYPDFEVRYSGQTFLIECKNVEKAKRRSPSERITVDFQRTRNQRLGLERRFYKPDEFHVLAACLWNRTGRWSFVYAPTGRLPRHPRYGDRLYNRVVVPLADDHLDAPWSESLTDVLDELVGGLSDQTQGRL